MTEPPIAVITEYPLPTSPDRVEDLWEANEQLNRQYDEPPHPDTLIENHTNTLHENDYWEAFEINLYGFGMAVYLWNSLGGYGLAISTLEDTPTALADIFESAAPEF